MCTHKCERDSSQYAWTSKQDKKMCHYGRHEKDNFSFTHVTCCKSSRRLLESGATTRRSTMLLKEHTSCTSGRNSMTTQITELKCSNNVIFALQNWISCWGEKLKSRHKITVLGTILIHNIQRHYFI